MNVSQGSAVPHSVRKGNRLPVYDYSQAGYYFVTICTKNKAHAIGKVVGADVLIGPHVRLTPLGELVEAYVHKMPTVVQHVIMPNHVHIMMRIGQIESGPMRTSAPTKSVSSLVHYLKSSVTKAWSSPVWQRSYYDHIVRDEADYLRVWDYIDTNPVKWREDCYYEED